MSPNSKEKIMKEKFEVSFNIKKWKFGGIFLEIETVLYFQSKDFIGKDSGKEFK